MPNGNCLIFQAKGMGLSLFGILLPIILMLEVLLSSAPKELVNNLFGESLADTLATYMVGLTDP